LEKPQVNEVDIPDAYGVKPESPDAQLVNMGYAAVPQLLNALTDRNFTRAFRGDNYIVDKEVFEVRDAALGILNKIGHMNFWPNERGALILGIGPIESPREYEDHWDTAIADARGWWKLAQAKGERDATAELLGAGNGDPVSLARWMIEKYPEQAFDPITSAIKQNEYDPDLQADLMSLLPQTKSTKTSEFARKMLLTSEFGQTVAASAIVLSSTDPVAALDGLITAWDKARKKQRDNYYSFEIEALVRALLFEGSPRAIDAASSGLSSERIELRQTILREVEKFLKLKGRPTAPDMAVSSSIENLLAKELIDLKPMQFTGVDSLTQDLSLRLCDFAAEMLSSFLPSVYRFEKSAPIASRNTQLKECLDVWRQRTKHS
jgi:hypothetical protein